MSNPYKITVPTAISFSGGRSSAYMLHQVLEANGGLPDETKVVFANTGKEMPETLDFVQSCANEWGVDITWLEYAGLVTVGQYDKGPHKGKDIKRLTYKLVGHSDASRAGEPFLRVIRDKRYLPNSVARICTANMKILPINQYLTDIGMKTADQLIGIRADEQRRAVRINGIADGGFTKWCPMYTAGVTSADVGKFWDSQPFDLGLPSYQGVTALSNCDLCYLKGKRQKASIIRERPDLADWWIAIESEVGQTFRQGESYQQLKDEALSNQSFDFGEDTDTIPCFCSD